MRLRLIPIIALFVAATIVAVNDAGAAGKELRFSVKCTPGPVAQVDPLVSPGGPSAHMHQFFGNRGVTSTRESPATMRTRGTTCQLSNDTGAYWVPTLYINGVIIPPTQVLVYYRNNQAATNIAPHTADTGIVSTNHEWLCKDSDVYSRPPNCTGIPSHPDGAGLRIRFLPYTQADGTRTPNVTLNIRYGRQNLTGATFSMGVAGHGDFWNVWDQGAYAALVARCLDPNGVWRRYTYSQWEARCNQVTDADFALGA